MTYDLLAVGDVMLDVHIPAALPGETVHEPIRVCAGGSAVNAARTARRLGAQAAVVGRVGDDPAGAAIADDLRRSGIEALLETESGGSTGTVAYIGTGVAADRGATAGFRPAALPPARVTLVSGYLDADGIAEALRQAQGLRALDLQRPGQPAFDADILLGPELDVDDLGRDHRVVCATLGARGAIAVRGAERVEVAPPRVLDQSVPGSGDAFAAGFLLALAAGHSLAACVERGHEAAAGPF
jgi:ribokinase